MSDTSALGSSADPFTAPPPVLPPEPQLELRAVTTGSIVARTLEVLRANLGKALGVTALVHLPGLVFMLYAAHQQLPTRGARLYPEAQNLALVRALLNLVLAGVAAAPVTYLVFQHLRRQPATLGEAVRQGLRRIVPAALASVVVMLLGCLATMAFIVPGLIVFTGLYVTIPTVVIERVGVGKALSRSWKLTKGYRGTIFGFMVLLVAVLFASGFVLGLLHLQEGASTAGSVATWLVTTCFGAVSAVAAGVTYHDLRTGKEGVETDELARVFD